MKVKRSKHVVHHSDGYTPVVRCTLNRRHKVSGSRREESWCTGVSVAFPQKADIEQMAIYINHATTAMSTDMKLVWDAPHTTITDTLCEGHRVQLDGLGSLTMEPSNRTGSLRMGRIARMMSRNCTRKSLYTNKDIIH